MFFKKRKHPFAAAVAMLSAATILVSSASYAIMSDRQLAVTAGGKAGKLAISLSGTGVDTSDYTDTNLYDAPQARAIDIAVNNNGNVMADVVTTLKMTVTSARGTTKPTDADFSAYDLTSVDGQAEFELYDASDVTIGTDSCTIASGAKPLCSDSGRVVDKNTITYTLPSETLAGSSTYADSEREVDSANADDSKAHSFVLVVRDSFAPPAPSAYRVTIDITSSAVPHRGGTTKNWTSTTTAEANYELVSESNN